MLVLSLTSVLLCTTGSPKRYVQIRTMSKLRHEDTLGMIIDELLSILHSLQFLYDSLSWIKAGPLGIKLNHSLTRMMEKVLVLIIRKFASIVKLVEFVHFPVIRLIACFGFGGVTTQLMLAIDVLRLISVHIAIIHRILYILHWVLSELIKSLWLLFRGKKSNILRHRIDTNNYDSKQLLFGTVLFSILLFLYPTFLGENNLLKVSFFHLLLVSYYAYYP